MKKKVIAMFLAGMMILQPVVHVAAAEPMAQTGTNAEESTVQAEETTAHTGETQYVVMSHDIHTVEDVVDLGESPESIAQAEMQEAGIAVVDLSASEAAALERNAVLVEEDIEFHAFTASDEIPMQEEDITVTDDMTVLDEIPASDTGQQDVPMPAEAGLQEDGQTDQVTELCDPIVEWNLRAVNAEAYVHDAAAGERVKIALLDSGVNYRPDMPVAGHVTTLEGRMEDVLMFTDATGHGTAMASLINASSNEESIQGMNADAEVYSVQVLDESNTGKLSGVVQGIYWAIENDMDIINMSFGTPYNSQILHQAVLDAHEAGIIMVAAAGNDAAGAVQYPAAYGEVIAVGASNMQGQIAECSTSGSQVDIYAPGEEVLANSPLFATDIHSGSSIACAQVSAAASVILEKDKTKGSQFVRSLLENTANQNFDPEYGKGLLDVGAAVEQYATFTVEAGAGGAVSNETALPVFESDEVYALWVDGDHQTLVNESGAEQGYRLMYAACTYPDHDADMKANRRFHGSKNYWTTLDFLVDLAHAYYIKDNDLVQTVYAEANATKLGQIESTNSGTSFGKPTVQIIKDYLADDDVFQLPNKDPETVDEQPYVDESTRHNKAYKIMGVVAHLVGDIYAHRTRVTTGMESIFTKSDFGNKWKEFWDLVVENKMEFRNIATYTPGVSHIVYEDNTSVVSSRFTNAKQVIRNLIDENGTYNFRTKAWNKAALINSDTLYKYNNQ